MLGPRLLTLLTSPDSPFGTIDTSTGASVNWAFVGTVVVVIASFFLVFNGLGQLARSRTTDYAALAKQGTSNVSGLLWISIGLVGVVGGIIGIAGGFVGNLFGAA